MDWSSRDITYFVIFKTWEGLKQKKELGKAGGKRKKRKRDRTSIRDELSPRTHCIPPGLPWPQPPPWRLRIARVPVIRFTASVSSGRGGGLGKGGFLIFLQFGFIKVLCGRLCFAGVLVGEWRRGAQGMRPWGVHEALNVPFLPPVIHPSPRAPFIWRDFVSEREMGERGQLDGWGAGSRGRSTRGKK